MRLHLGDDGEHGPILGHVKPEDWHKLADGQKTGRWIAFPGDQAAVWLRLDARDGLTVATGMFVWSAEPLTVKELRSIPLGRLVDLSAAHGDDALRMVTPPERLRQSSAQALPKATRKHPGRRGVSQDDLREVAEAWAWALEKHPRAPMQAAAKRTNRSVAQTRRLVRRAEHLGLSD